MSRGKFHKFLAGIQFAGICSESRVSRPVIMQEERRFCIRSAPSLTLVDVKAIIREKVTRAGVWICEKAIRLKARGSVGLHRLVHLGHYEDEEERQEEAADAMTAATGTS